MKSRTAKTAQRAEGQTTLTISLPELLKKRIEEEAEKQQRSVSNYLVVELTAMLDAKQKPAAPVDHRALAGTMLVDEPGKYGEKASKKRKEA